MSSTFNKALWNLDLESIRLFALLCEAGTMKSVSDRERTSLSRVSKKISSLEQKLGTKVIQEIARGPAKPTPEGLLVLGLWNECSRLFEQYLHSTAPSSAMFLCLHPDDLHSLNLDFGLEHIFLSEQHIGNVQIHLKDEPWVLNGASQHFDLALWPNWRANTASIDELTRQNPGLLYETLALPHCVLVAHASHPLCPEIDISASLLLDERIFSVGGADLFNPAARGGTEPLAKISASVPSTLKALSTNPSADIYCLPVSALKVLRYYANLSVLHVAPSLNTSNWTICFQRGEIAERLAKGLLRFLQNSNSS